MHIHTLGISFSGECLIRENYDHIHWIVISAKFYASKLCIFKWNLELFTGFCSKRIITRMIILSKSTLFLTMPHLIFTHNLLHIYYDHLYRQFLFSFVYLPSLACIDIQRCVFMFWYCYLFCDYKVQNFLVLFCQLVSCECLPATPHGK